jgi:hypothetical protein
VARAGNLFPYPIADELGLFANPREFDLLAFEPLILFFCGGVVAFGTTHDSQNRKAMHLTGAVQVSFRIKRFS